MIPDSYAAMRLSNARNRVARLEHRLAASIPATYNQALTDLAHARARVEYWEERAK